MKKNLFLTLILTLFFLMPNVKAETLYFDYKSDTYAKEYDNQSFIYLNLDVFYSEHTAYSQANLDELYRLALDYYNEHSSDYPYYSMSVLPAGSTSGWSFMLWLHLYTSVPTSRNVFGDCSKSVEFLYNGSKYTTNDGWSYCHPYSYGFDKLFNSQSTHTLEGPYYNPLSYYSSNFDLIFDSSDTYIVNNYNGQTLTFNNGDVIPTYYESNIADNYTTVNLDNYHYVLLSLKDYSQTEAFSTTLQVKGMIGITPIYNYGTTEKVTNPGDRCNTIYSDFTNYSMYVLSSDLSNKSIYRVEKCKDGSIFKFDNTIFDVTYVTDDNVDNPVVTINGQDYSVLTDLSWTAVENEVNNVIPGESVNLVDSLGSSFSDIFSNIGTYLNNIWNVIVTFMSYVTKIFSLLPSEFQVISISVFTIGLILGLIKIIKS